METDEARICRLCFEICKHGFEFIKDTTLDTLHFMLPNLDLGTRYEAVVCNSCVSSLKECSDFKTDYLHRRDHAFIKHKDVILSEPRKCLGENVEDGSTVGCDCVCCFCTTMINSDSAVLLSTEENDITVLLEKYFPELLQNLSVDSTACKACYQTLQNRLKFLNNCSAIEERIKNYCKVEETDSKGQVNLNAVLNIMPRNQLQNNIYNNLHPVKVEDSRNQMDNCDKIKIENENLIEIVEQQLHDDNYKDIKTETEQDNSDRYDASRAKHNHKLPSCENTLEETMYECELCTYQSKHKRDIPVHMLTHRSNAELSVYMCEICAFQTKYKTSLQRHNLTHKSISEVTTYKCEICPFHTKYKRSLHLHMLTHKDISEVAMYKCETCGFQTKHKKSVQQHVLLAHEEASVYKCEKCVFQTKYANHLQRHMLTHGCTSKESVYTCDTCGYRTVKKGNLKKHMPIHKSSSEVTMYKCEVCAFQTKHKESLRLHMLTHKNPSEVPTYKCEICVYQSKWKRNLTNHMLSHKSAAEVPMYKCKICTYQTKRKSTLSQHIMTHKTP